MSDTPGYDASTVRVMPWPPSEDAGNGWWRLTWHVEYDSAVTTELPPLPAPWPYHPDTDEPAKLRTLVGIIGVGPGRLRLEVISRYKAVHPAEIEYVGDVVADLQTVLGPLKLDGLRDHPWLMWKRGTIRSARPEG